MGFWDKVKEAVTGETTRKTGETVSTFGASTTPVPAPTPAATSPAPPTRGEADGEPPRSESVRMVGAEAGHQTYTVKNGDTLSEIGAKFGVAGSDIASLNKIKSPELIYPGQVFKIPTT